MPFIYFQQKQQKQNKRNTGINAKYCIARSHPGEEWKGRETTFFSIAGLLRVPASMWSVPVLVLVLVPVSVPAGRPSCREGGRLSRRESGRWSSPLRHHRRRVARRRRLAPAHTRNRVTARRRRRSRAASTAPAPAPAPAPATAHTERSSALRNLRESPGMHAHTHTHWTSASATVQSTASRPRRTNQCEDGHWRRNVTKWWGQVNFESISRACHSSEDILYPDIWYPDKLWAYPQSLPQFWRYLKIGSKFIWPNHFETFLRLWRRQLIWWKLERHPNTMLQVYGW